MFDLGMHWQVLAGLGSDAYQLRAGHESYDGADARSVSGATPTQEQLYSIQFLSGGGATTHVIVGWLAAARSDVLDPAGYGCTDTEGLCSDKRVYFVWRTANIWGLLWTVYLIRMLLDSCLPGSDWILLFALILSCCSGICLKIYEWLLVVV